MNVNLVDESLITFTKVGWEVPDTRWLFFYSKTGVRTLELLDVYDCKEDITFVCGRQSLRSVHGHPSLSSFHLRECVIYDQSLREDISSATFDLAIMTSPLNFEAFAKAKRTASTYMAIGDTTAAALHKQGIAPLIAASPSEDGIAATLSNWLAR